MRRRFSILFGFLAIVATAGLLFVPDAAYATDVSTTDAGPYMTSGYGGSPYRLPCAPGSYLVGMSGNIGAWIDRIGANCAKWIPSQSNFGNGYGDRYTTGTTGNSTGGSPASAICQEGLLVKGFTFRRAVPDQGPFMQNIRLVCVAALPPHGQQADTPGLISGADCGQVDADINGPCNPIPVTCPGDEVAIGLQGTSGDFVDQVGLICGPPPTAQSSSAMSPSSPSVEGHWNEAARHRIVSMGTTPGVPGDILVEGTWQTDQGTMTFSQNKSTVTGTYPAGTLSGTLNNGVLDGNWVQAKGDEKCAPVPGQGRFYGLFSFTFSNQNRHFDGRWTYCNTSITSGYWKGDRIK